jgi:hypothetical protein
LIETTNQKGMNEITSEIIAYDVVVLEHDLNFWSTSFIEHWLLIPEPKVKGQVEPLNCIIL